MAAQIWTGELRALQYTYDFDNDGGAIGTIALGSLPDGFIVQSMQLVIETTITSGGTPTIVIGEDGAGDADGYFADFFGTPTAGTLVAGGGALLAAPHIVDSAKDGVQVTIGVAAVTAGKFNVFVTGIQS